MKKLLTVSLVAMMAVTTARAEIASKAYVDQQDDAVEAIIGALSGLNEGITKTSVVAAINSVASTASSDIENMVTHDGAVGNATTPVYVTAQGVATAGTELGTMAYEAASDYTKSADLGTMASENAANYYTKTAADAAFDAAGDADAAEAAAKSYTDTAITDMQIKSNLSSSIATDTGSTTKYPSVAAVEAAIQVAAYDDSGLDARLDVLEGSGAGSVAKAEQDAKAYADSLASNYDAAGDAAAAEAAAKSYTDTAITDMQIKSNLSSSISTDTGSTTKYPSVKAVEDAISAADGAMDSRVDALESTVGDSTSGLVKDVADLGTNKLDSSTASSTYQTLSNLSSSMTTDTGSTTKYPSVAAVEAAIQASDTAMDSRVDDLEATADNLKALAFKDTVATADIDANAVTTAKIADDAVTLSKITSTLPSACTGTGAECVLKSSNGAVAWEVIQRATGETPNNTTGSNAQ